MAKNRTITVKGTETTIFKQNNDDYISLTDMVKPVGDEAIMYNWLRNRNTIEFLGIWEQIYNTNFKPIEFDRFKNLAGLNSFTLSLNLNEIAITQMKSLLGSNNMKKLK